MTSAKNNQGRVQVERRGQVVWVTMHRPSHRNALSKTMVNAMREVLETVAGDSSTRALVLRGADGVFSGGADLGDRDALADGVLPWMRLVGDLVVRLHRLSIPTIAMVEGPAYGYAANLAFGCDLTLAADDAYFCENFTQRGFSIDGGGSYLLPRLVGLKRAKELIFLAGRITAPEAAQMGLINRAVPHGELLALTTEWAERLANGPTIALGCAKRVLDDSHLRSMEETVTQEAYGQAVCFRTADWDEGIAAFFERRDPRFTGT